MERYRSGHNEADSKSVIPLTGYRGFESHSLRQKPKDLKKVFLFIF